MIAALAGAGVSAAAILHAGPALAPVVPGIGPALGITHRQEGAEGVALTFDDGPHPQGTPEVLEILREAGATATFFLVGEQVARRPSLAAEIVAAGPPGRAALPPPPQPAAVDARASSSTTRTGPWRRSRRRAARRSPTAARPTGSSAARLCWAVRRRAWRPVLWSLWGRDWARRATASSIARRSTAGARAGDILLLHDADYYSAPGSWVRTVAALPIILEELDSRGLKPVSLRR